MTTKEEKFFQALQNIFLGAEVEGQGGFINLMKIKRTAYKKIEKQLQKDIKDALINYPNFRDELFDKLYTFFQRYFSENGSIYFNATPFHNNIYEKVYTAEKDIAMFWKTQQLYYVKTDRLYRSMPIEISNIKFYIDASSIENKKNNERRSLIYEFQQTDKERGIVLNVYYTEGGKKTKTEEIIKKVKQQGIIITESLLEKVFNTFERQAEVDYFIHKNAKSFLQEQFKLWSYQYFWEGAKEWGAERVNQLQILRDIAYKIIDFISQFENELVKIWNKPKFVKSSRYVITLDRIPDLTMISSICSAQGMLQQIKEWKELEIVDDSFSQQELLDLIGKAPPLPEKIRHLPIDTSYFKELENELISLFDDLDEQLDGWLIKSENYQALNTLLPKFKGKIQTIYIDPPFNLESSDQFLYRTNYKDSCWATLLENRLQLAREWLNQQGSIFVRCDYNGNWIVRCLLDDIFGKDNFRNEIIVRRGSPKAGLFLQFGVIKTIGVMYDNLFWYSKNPEAGYEGFINELEKESGNYWTSFKKIYDRPTLRYELLGINLTKGQWMWRKDRAYKAVENYNTYLNESKITGESLQEYSSRTGIKEFVRRVGDTIQYWVPPKISTLLDNNWLDITGYSSKWNFTTENSEQLLRRVIESTTSNKSMLILDFFLGSGTTTAVAHKLGRRWVGVEMGEHFYTVILPRMKKVLAYDKSGISKDVEDYKGGGFFKVFELEQYEEALARCKYQDGDLFNRLQGSPYQEYVFFKDEKLLDALEIDLEKQQVNVNLENLYKDIDIPETLSALLGKPIRKISRSEVHFTDGSVVNMTDLDYRMIKPLVWWE